MELLLSMIKEEDKDIRILFKKLYIENTNPSSLIDTEDLNKLRESDPDLFNRAVEYFSRFNSRRTF